MSKDERTARFLSSQSRVPSTTGSRLRISVSITRTWTVVALALWLLVTPACTQKDESSDTERQQARDREVQSFTRANGAAVVPDIRGAAVTLDWQKALRDPNRIYAFRGAIDDIFEKDGNYFLRVSDIDNKLRWIIQCSESEADDARGQRDKSLEFLLLAEVTEIRPAVGEDSISEIMGTLRKLQPSTAPL